MTPERLAEIKQEIADTDRWCERTGAPVPAGWADNTVRVLLAEVERLQAEVAEWRGYDQDIKAALGGCRHHGVAVPDSIAAVVEKASRYDDLCD